MQAGNPAAGEDVFANVELGVERAHMTDEVNDAQSARLQRVRMRTDDVGKLVAPRVLEGADGEQLVVFTRNLPKIAFDDADGFRETQSRKSSFSSTTCSGVALTPTPRAP